jgi:nucleoside-diphosphate-sugar epimerase
MNYLVTGGAGFIGSNIVEELLKRGENVRVLDNFSTGRRSNIETFLGNPDFEMVEGDIRSPFTVMEAMSTPFSRGKGTGIGKASTSTSASTCPIDYVLHQAALPSVPRSIKDPLTTNEVCVVGTLNVLKAALACKVKRVVYASSSSVYGDSEELPKHEGMTPNPLSPYACAKLAGEHYCQVFSRLYGLEAVALRYFNVFGPRQDPTSQYAAVIPKFIAAIREGRPPVIYGDGEQSRDFTPVANVVAANLAACSVPLGGQVKAKVKVEKETGDRRRKTGVAGPGSSVPDLPLTSTSTSAFLLSNVAVGERYTLNFIVNEICRVVGKRVKPIYDPPRPGDVRHSLASVKILTERLGLTHRTTFLVGLEQLTRRAATYEEPKAERIKP